MLSPVPPPIFFIDDIVGRDACLNGFGTVVVIYLVYLYNLYGGNYYGSVPCILFYYSYPGWLRDKGDEKNGSGEEAGDAKD